MNLIYSYIHVFLTIHKYIYTHIYDMLTSVYSDGTHYGLLKLVCLFNTMYGSIYICVNMITVYIYIILYYYTI